MSRKPDIQRLVGDIVQYGTIESVDLSAATVRVRLGDAVTGDVPWLAGRAGKLRVWSPPSAGEQCLFLASEGDAEAGVAILGLFSDAHPAPDDDGDVVRLTFDDDATIAYDVETHALEIVLPQGGTADIVAPGGITLKGPVKIDGPLEVTQDAKVDGTLTATTDVVGGGKSLKGHKHTGVQTGGGVSGAPQ